MSDDQISVTLRLKDVAKFYAEAEAAARGIKRIGDESGRTSREADRLKVSLKTVEAGMSLLRPAAAVAGLILLTQSFSAAGAAGFALVAAVAPVAGVIAALPAALGLAAQGVGVLALAFHGLGGALGGLNEAIDPKKFALLTQPAQDFVLALQDAKAPIVDLQRAVGAGLFPGLTSGLSAALPVLAALQPELAMTGRILGFWADQLGRLVGSSGFLADLRSQAAFNNVQLGLLASTGVYLVNVFRNLMVGARPLVATIVGLTAAWARNADRSVAAARASGRLAGFFRGVGVALSRVGRLTADLAVGLFNIGRVANAQLGEGLLVSLVRGADAFRRWTASASGTASVTKFFQNARPVAYAFAQLLGDIGRVLLGFGGDSQGLVGILGTLDSTVRVIGALSSALGPSTVAYLFLGGKLMQTGLGAITAFKTALEGLSLLSGLGGSKKRFYAKGLSDGEAYRLGFDTGKGGVGGGIGPLGKLGKEAEEAKKASRLSRLLGYGKKAAGVGAAAVGGASLPEIATGAAVAGSAVGVYKVLPKHNHFARTPLDRSAFDPSPSMGGPPKRVIGPQVDPRLSNSSNHAQMSAPRFAAPSVSSARTDAYASVKDGGPASSSHHSHITLEVDGRVLAEVVADHNGQDGARD